MGKGALRIENSKILDKDKGNITFQGCQGFCSSIETIVATFSHSYYPYYTMHISAISNCILVPLTSACSTCFFGMVFCLSCASSFFGMFVCLFSASCFFSLRRPSLHALGCSLPALLWGVLCSLGTLDLLFDLLCPVTRTCLLLGVFLPAVWPPGSFCRSSERSPWIPQNSPLLLQSSYFEPTVPPLARRLSVSTSS